jgi:hypothetical protein
VLFQDPDFPIRIGHATASVLSRVPAMKNPPNRRVFS